MPNWTFYNPVNISFGEGSFSHIEKYVESKNILIVTTAGAINRGFVNSLKSSSSTSILDVIDDVPSNPDINYLDQISRRLDFDSSQIILAIGGGSVIDTAKVLSRILPQRGKVSLYDHFYKEQVFKNFDTLPVIAVPTTAGTGAEVTPFATVWDFQNKRKFSRH